MATRLTVVTWTRRIDDPVVLWGSLIYAPGEIGHGGRRKAEGFQCTDSQDGDGSSP